MSRHIEIGRKGEDLAAHWLIRNGFTLLRQNWQHGRYEVDILAGRNNILHVIEVKTRRSKAYGHPEESVSRKKIEHMLQGALGCLYQWPKYLRVQYDVLAITLTREETPEIVLFEDVYL